MFVICLVEEYIFPVFRVHDGVYNPGLQVQENRPRDVMFVICLVEEYIFPVNALSGMLLQNALRADAMLLAELLPELESDLIATLPQLEHHHLTRHVASLFWIS